MIPLGQFRDTFIIAVDDEGVAIIDQHVAHERVLFEQISERLSAGRLESQRLLTPLLIDLSPAQRQALAAHRATLERFGMDIEEFGGDSVRLSAMPSVLEPAECEAAMRALADDLEGLDRGSRAEDALRRIAATMACHAAVKANYPLTLREDAVHPRRAAAHRLLERLPPRPPGRAAAVPPGDREEFSSYLSSKSAWRGRDASRPLL